MRLPDRYRSPQFYYSHPWIKTGIVAETPEIDFSAAMLPVAKEARVMQPEFNFFHDVTPKIHDYAVSAV